MFLDAVLNKRYGNPGADVMTVLAGLDDVDAIFSDFVAVLEDIIGTEKTSADARIHEDWRRTRIKAVQVAIITVTGTYNTALSSYFISKDMFPGLVEVSWI